MAALFALRRLSFSLPLLLLLSRLPSAQAQEEELDTLTLDPVFTQIQTAFREPTATAPIPEPTGIDEPCGRVREAIVGWRGGSDEVMVSAELAFECLNSVPIDQDIAMETIEAIRRLLQFQSTLAYLENPPEDYGQEPVDIYAGLDEIEAKVSEGSYSGEYDFEADLSLLMRRAYDGHLAFEGMTYAGAFSWRRNPRATLVSASLGDGTPGIYLWSDIESGSSEALPLVTQINGEDATTFVQKEADLVAYHDPDARWNTMFYRPVVETSGIFINTEWYPGPTVDLTLDNGTTLTFTNLAQVANVSAWEAVEDGPSFFQEISTVSISGLFKRDAPHEVPHDFTKRLEERLRSRSDRRLHKRTVPAVGYPEPYVDHPGGEMNNVYISAYFLENSGVSDVGVLALHTFATISNEDTDAFQLLVDEFLAECRNRGTRKVIIDVRSNGGGKLLLGYDAFRQFFPDTEPYDGSRFRAHESANIIGTSFSELRFSTVTAPVFLSPFNYQFLLDNDQNPYQSWDQLNGPVQDNGDQFSNIFRLDLENEYTTESENFGIGLSITGYRDRSNIRERPFAPEDIVILSDGVCASTCSLFVDFMTVESGVRTFSVGGRPEFGPMQPVGGTKGSQVLFAEQIVAYAQVVLQGFPRTRSQLAEWASILPIPFPIGTFAALINFRDHLRQDSSIPAQFTNETANCRIFYTPEMFTDVTQLWGAVAEAAWGGDNEELDEARCVPGSSHAGSGGSRRNSGAAGALRPMGLASVGLVAGLVAFVSTWAGSLI